VSVSDGILLGPKEIRRLWPEVERSAQEVAGSIGQAIPAGFGFALLIFSFGERGYLTHVSNCNREDLVKCLRETADVLEAKRDAPPGVVGQKD
jgi:hypothetical protein